MSRVLNRYEVTMIEKRRVRYEVMAETEEQAIHYVRDGEAGSRKDRAGKYDGAEYLCHRLLREAEAVV